MAFLSLADAILLNNNRAKADMIRFKVIFPSLSVCYAAIPKNTCRG